MRDENGPRASGPPCIFLIIFVTFIFQHLIFALSLVGVLGCWGVGVSGVKFDDLFFFLKKIGITTLKINFCFELISITDIFVLLLTYIVKLHIFNFTFLGKNFIFFF